MLRPTREALRGEGRKGRVGWRGALRVLAEHGHPEDVRSQETGRHDQVEFEEGDFCC